jgi:hypothetical protein
VVIGKWICILMTGRRLRCWGVMGYVSSWPFPSASAVLQWRLSSEWKPSYEASHMSHISCAWTMWSWLAARSKNTCSTYGNCSNGSKHTQWVTTITCSHSCYLSMGLHVTVFTFESYDCILFV